MARDLGLHFQAGEHTDDPYSLRCKQEQVAIKQQMKSAGEFQAQYLQAQPKKGGGFSRLKSDPWESNWPGTEMRAKSLDSNPIQLQTVHQSSGTLPKLEHKCSCNYFDFFLELRTMVGLIFYDNSKIPKQKSRKNGKKKIQEQFPKKKKKTSDKWVQPIDTLWSGSNLR